MVIWSLILCQAAFAQPASSPAKAPSLPRPPVIRASSAILVDATSGQVIYEKNANVMRPPASTTKIMTAILLLEHTLPTDAIKASKRVTQIGGSSLNLQLDETISAHDALYALMLRSANDACVAVAEHVAGSDAKFAGMMTAKAREIGATNTVFHNSNGLNQPPNLTTARDLALMARYASRYPEFNEATRTKFYTLKRSSASKDVVLRNHAKILWRFPGADGIKTGYTAPAGRCFVGAATVNGWRLISVVMNSPDLVGETSALLKYGFDQFEAKDAVNAGQVCANVPVRYGKSPNVAARAQDTVRFLQPKTVAPVVSLQTRFDQVNAPIAPGARVGTLEVWADGKQVGSTPLLAVTSVERAPFTEAGGFVRGWPLTLLFVAIVIAYVRTIAKTSVFRRDSVKAFLRGYYRRG